VVGVRQRFEAASIDRVVILQDAGG
jgi:hypothetical protein